MKRLLTTIFILGLGVSSCQVRSGQNSPAQVSPLPQDPLMQVYFDQSQASQYQETDRQLTRPGDDLEALVVEAIESAQPIVS